MTLSRRPVPRTSPAPADSGFDGLRVLVGSIAGLAGLVYITGGVVVTLRLVLEGIPALGFAGQLPREVLFSLGASAVVVPAILLGTAIGGIEQSKGTRERIVRQHRGWWFEAHGEPATRRTFVFFYGFAPIVLLTPSLLVGIRRDEHLSDGIWSAAVVVVAALALVTWVGAWRGRLKSTWPTQDPPPRYRPTIREWLVIVSGGLLSLVAAAIAWASTGNWRYSGLFLAWLVALLVVLLFVWMRGTIGDHFREDVSQPVVRYGVMSLGATMILTVPAWLALAAVQPLDEATVCGKGGAATVTGLYIGETKDRVYLGLPDTNRVQVIAYRGVERVVVGDGVGPDDCAVTSG